MADLHVYIGIENLALTNPQRATLVQGIQALGANNASFNPALRNHWRIRLDNDAAIFEALFDSDTISIQATKNRLAAIFEVDPATITTNTQAIAYGLLITYTRNSTNYLRLLLFGWNGEFPTYAESHAAVLAYLSANAAAWGDAA